MKQIIQNINKCPHSSVCNQNLCPLDINLNEAKGTYSDFCRWMRGPRVKKIGRREFVSGGSIMPDAILNFVPQCNLKRLNESSQKRWNELNK